MNFNFAIDKSLGKLSKWLRLLGFDTIDEPDVAGTFFEKEFESDRVILTRTLRLKNKFGSKPLIFIESNDLDDQLRQVIQALGIRKSDIRLFSRCLQCNIRISGVMKEQVFGQVPDYIYETNDSFQQCPRCKKIYWPGSHGRRSMERIEGLFK